MRSPYRLDRPPAQKCKLSVLICGLPNRLESIGRIYKKLNVQTAGKSVEVITLTDNKYMSVGTKRNLLVQMAVGDYVIFIDDDDDISDDYIDQLLEAIKSEPSCVSIKCWETTEGRNRTMVHFTIQAGKNHRVRNEKFYIPNHICAIRSCIAKVHQFPDINKSEDHKWAADILPDLTCEVQVGAIYFYNFSRQTSETRGR